MTAAELKATRQKLGLTALQLGLALGYSGSKAGIATTIYRLERGEREIPPCTARLAAMFARYGVPEALA